MEKFKDYTELNEAGLSRILKHMTEHDCGGITANRNARDCGNGEKYTPKENKFRNRNLVAKLQTKGYGVIKTRGEYPEGGMMTYENSYFVFDQKDSVNLKSDLKKFGKEFEQDSILFIPKGSKDGFLIGTNNCENNDIPFGQEINIGKRFLGKKGKWGSSMKGNRPWAFGELLETVNPPGNGYGWWMLNRIADATWEEHMEMLDIDAAADGRPGGE